MPTPMACALIKTSPGFGSGTGTSSNCMTPGGPGFWTWMSFMRFLLDARALRCRRRRREQEVLHRVPQQLAILAKTLAVRGVRQDDILPVAVRQLAEEFEQIAVGRITVPFATCLQHRTHHL